MTHPTITAVLDSTGQTNLTTPDGQTHDRAFADLPAARRAVREAAAKHATGNGVSVQLKITDPSGVHALLVHADGGAEIIDEDLPAPEQAVGPQFPPATAESTDTPATEAEPVQTEEEPAPKQAPAVDGSATVAVAMDEPLTFASAAKMSPEQLARRLGRLKVPKDHPSPATAPAGDPPAQTATTSLANATAGIVRAGGQELEPPLRRSRFLAPPETVEEDTAAPEYDPIVGDRGFLPGVQDSSVALADPQHASEPEPPTAIVEVSQRTLWLVPACGGAGVSTLAGLLGEDTLDATLHPPVREGRAVIVAPTHPAGLAGAEGLAMAKARGELIYDVVGIVWVQDRPKISTATARECRRIGSMFPKLWSMPFEAAWREPGADPVPHRHNTKTLVRTLSKFTFRKENKQ